jgi:hypothetical protein
VASDHPKTIDHERTCNNNNLRCGENSLEMRSRSFRIDNYDLHEALLACLGLKMALLAESVCAHNSSAFKQVEKYSLL